MNIILDIAKIKEKAALLIPEDQIYKFNRDFDNDSFFMDIIENPDDYMA